MDRKNLAHILANGTVDSGWNPVVNGRIRSLIVVGNTVYVGGDFGSSLAALDATTGQLRPWNPQLNPTAFVYSLLQKGNVLYVGGKFTSAQGQTRNNLAAFDLTTGALLPWSPGVTVTSGLVEVQALAASGNTVYVGGFFSEVGGQVRNNLAAVDATTGAVTPWNPNPDSGVYSIATNGNTVYVGGQFSTVGGQSRRGFAAIDPVTGNVGSLNLNLALPASTPLVYDLVLDGTRLWMGGRFTSVSGQVRDNTAAIDLGSGSVTSWNPSAGGPVYSLALNGSSVYVGGVFSLVGGEARNCLAALDSGTGTLTSWNPGANGQVNALKVSVDTVYAGGGFTSIGGQSRNRIAALDATTGSATSWNPNASSSVQSLSVAGNAVYAGGSFTTIGGQSRSYAAALDMNTGSATSWNPNASSAVSSLFVSGNTVYAGGFFTTIGGQSRSYAAALDATTGNATAWNANVDYVVNSWAVVGNTVYMGGYFSTVGGQSRRYLAAVDSQTGAPLIWSAVGISNEVRGIYALDGVVYLINHNPYSSSMLQAFDGSTGTQASWAPQIDRLPQVNNGFENMAGGKDFIFVSAGELLYRFGQVAPLSVLPTAPVTTGVTTTGLSAQWTSAAATDGGLVHTLAASVNSGNPVSPVNGSLRTTGLSGGVGGLMPNTRYFVFVQSCEGNLCTPYVSGGSTVTLAAVPSVSTGSLTSTTVNLLIGANGNPFGTRYTVEQSVDGGAYGVVATTPTAAVVVVQGLEAGRTYRYRVRAVNEGNVSSGASNEVAVALPPEAPSRGAFSGVGVTSVSASWASSPIGVASYNFVVSMNALNPPINIFGGVSVVDTAGTIRGLVANTPYHGFVRVCNGSSCSSYLPIGSTVTLAAVPGLTMGSVTTNSVQLSIGGNGNSAGTTYAVEQSTDNVHFVEIYVGTGTTVTAWNLVAGNVYYFRAQARGIGGTNTAYATLTVSLTAQSMTQSTVQPQAFGVATGWVYPNMVLSRSVSHVTVYQVIEGTNVQICDMRGALIRGLMAGSGGTVEWDLRDESGRAVDNGVYYFRLSGGSKVLEMVVQR